MSETVEHEAEILRLARVLGADPDELRFLDGAAVPALRELRTAVSDRLLERNRREFERAVALADRIPGGLAAKLAEHAMGPVLGGRAAALLRPDKAAELTRHLPPDFLASVAENVDLRRVGPLLAGIAPRTMAAAGAELRRREEWIVLGAFVGYVEDDVLAVLLDVFDGEALLRAGFVVENPGRLDAVVALLSDARLDELLLAADGHGLWREAVALVGHLGSAQAARVVAAVDRLDDDRLARLAGTLSADDGLRAAAEPLVALAPAPLREKMGVAA